MTDFDVRTVNLRALNSMTKYPSIPTYHALDPKNGGLLEECVTFPDGVIATEKIDGTNARIVLLPDGTYVLGSREELLYASGDLIGNPALGIVDNLRPVADDIAGEYIPLSDAIIVIYLELFGGKIGGAARQYVKDTQSFGWRIFDVMDLVDYRPVLELPTERISAWRDAGGQPFVDENVLNDYSTSAGIPLTPRLLDEFYADAMPTTIQGMADMLADIAPHTRVRLDDGNGKAEGVVFRSPDRKVIAKARFQDYERTLKRRGKAGVR